jgi:Reverse transcriptase-like
VECKNNGEAELRALLLAMSAAEQAKLRDVIFRTDCESAARPHRGESEHLRPLREAACRYMAPDRLALSMGGALSAALLKLATDTPSHAS